MDLHARRSSLAHREEQQEDARDEQRQPSLLPAEVAWTEPNWARLEDPQRRDKEVRNEDETRTDLQNWASLVESQARNNRFDDREVVQWKTFIDKGKNGFFYLRKNDLRRKEMEAKSLINATRTQAMKENNAPN